MKNSILFALFCVIVIFLIIYIVYLYIEEIKEYNKGVCPHCGGKYIFLHTDHNNNVILKCKHCKREIMLEWYKPKNIDLL